MTAAAVLPRSFPDQPVTSTTGRSLRQRLVRLTALTGIVLLISTVMLYGANHTARKMRSQAVRAATGVADARQALVEADAAAITALSGSSVRLTGPGQDYVGKITLASQSLEQVAEVNAAGAQGSQTLQLLGSMISTYSAMITEANVAYANGQELLGTAQLWNASDFLHLADTGRCDNPGGILAELTNLDCQQREALTSDDTSSWTSGWTVLFWVLPALALLAALLDTQMFLRRRFRRRLNPELAAATLLVVAAVLVAPALVQLADHRLSRSVEGLGDVRRTRAALSAQEDAAGQQALSALLQRECPTVGTSCASTVIDVRPAGQPSTPTAATASVPEQSRRLGSATGIILKLLIGLIAGGVAVLVLVPAGLRRRINEYGFRT